MTNGKRRRRNGRKASPHGRVVARFNRRHRRRNGLAVRTNRRRTSHRRRNGLAVRTNRRSYRRRRNTGLSASAIFTPVQKLLSMIPGGKKIAPYVAPALYGAIGLLGVHFALKYGAKFIPAKIKQYVAPIGYTLGGVLLGLAVQFLPINANDKKALAAAMVVGGAGVDVFRKLTGSTALGDEYGEGGLWQLGEGMGDVSVPGYSGTSADPDTAAIHGEYADAEMADAYFSGNDLDPVEGEAALAGPRAWRTRFPMRRRATRQQTQCSRHAQQHGHRWGWLCKLIGFDKFRGIVALPAEQRVAYIAQLKQHAISSIPQRIAAQQAADAAQQVSGDFGATMYSGTGAGAAF